MGLCEQARNPPLLLIQTCSSGQIHKLESLKKSKAALNQVTADLQTLTDERLDLARQMKTEEASWRESRQRREVGLCQQRSGRHTFGLPLTTVLQLPAT